jgi:hypothetical protein
MPVRWQVMHVLVATTATQGQRASDRYRAREGELVHRPVAEHLGEALDADCGCRRVLVGAANGQVTTTVRVTDRLIDQSGLRQTLAVALNLREGDCAYEAYLVEVVDELVTEAGRWPWRRSLSGAVSAGQPAPMRSIKAAQLSLGPPDALVASGPGVSGRLASPSSRRLLR